jgi:hypothetical protein
MATKKEPAIDKAHIEQTMKMAMAAASPQEAELDAPARPTAVRFNRQEYQYLKSIFETEGKGLKVSTGIKMAALFVAEQIESGAMKISRAGIVDRRG